MIPDFDLAHARSTLARTVPAALLAAAGCSSDDDGASDAGPDVGSTVGDNAAGDLLDVRMIEVPGW